MAARLISCQLKNPDKADYEGFLKIVRECDHIQLTEDTYAVATDEYPKDIFERLEPFMDEDDSLVVIALSRFYMAHHNKDILDWLEKNV